jgi:hypothetical protein
MITILKSSVLVRFIAVEGSDGCSLMFELRAQPSHLFNEISPGFTISEALPSPKMNEAAIHRHKSLMQQLSNNFD